MGDIGGRVGDVEREREWEWLAEEGFWSFENEREGILGTLFLCFSLGGSVALCGKNLEDSCRKLG